MLFFNAQIHNLTLTFNVTLIHVTLTRKEGEVQTFSMKVDTRAFQDLGELNLLARACVRVIVNAQIHNLTLTLNV